MATPHGRTAAHAVLEEFGKQVGISDLAFDDGGNCAFGIDDKTVVNLEYDAPRRRVLIYSLIGAPGGDLAAAYGAILRANYLGVETHGPTFGLRPDDGALVLSQVLPEAILDLPTFEAALQNFVEVTEAWTARLPGLGAAAPTGSAPPPAMGSLRA